MAFTTNLLLEALPDTERRVLDPHLKPVELHQHEVLFEIRDTIHDVYFPLDAVVSLVVPLSTGETVETAMVGRDGLVGAAAALNGRLSLNRAIVQIGGSSLRCPLAQLKWIVQEHPYIRALVGDPRAGPVRAGATGRSVQRHACDREQVGKVAVACGRLARWGPTAAHSRVHRANAGCPAHECHHGRAHFAGSRPHSLLAGTHQIARHSRSSRNGL